MENYNEKIQELFKKKEAVKQYRSIILAIDDAQMLYYLKTVEPEVWERFKQWRFDIEEGKIGGMGVQDKDGVIEE